MYAHGDTHVGGRRAARLAASPPSGCPAGRRVRICTERRRLHVSAGSSADVRPCRRQPPAWLCRGRRRGRLGSLRARVAYLSVKSGTGLWESAGLAPITGRFRHGKTIGGWYYLERGDDGWSISLTVRGRAGRIVRLRAADGAGHRVHAQLQQPCLPGLAALCQ